MSPNQVEIDGKRRRLVLHGSCLDLLAICAGACCREWRVGVTLAEHASGLYASQRTCALTQKACEKEVSRCPNLIHELKKDREGACVHLGEDYRCSIYEQEAAGVSRLHLPGGVDVRPRGEISFLKEMVGTCGRLYTRDEFRYPQLNDDLLLRLIRLFDSKDTLSEVYGRLCQQNGAILTRGEFDEIVWLLNKHNIILSTENLSGLLAGMGGI